MSLRHMNLSSSSHCQFAPTAWAGLCCWYMKWRIMMSGTAIWSPGTCACCAGNGPLLFGAAYGLLQQSLCTMARCIEAHIVTNTGYLMNNSRLYLIVLAQTLDHIHIIPGCYGSGHIFCRLYNTSHMYYIDIYIYNIYIFRVSS